MKYRKRFLFLLLILNIFLTGCSFKSSYDKSKIPEKKNQIKKTDNDYSPNKIKENKKKTDEENDEGIVSVSIDKIGRTDPFKKFEEKSILVDELTGVIPKPPSYNQDSLLSKLLSITVSGILYDSVKPSAIINIDGIDHLIHKSDKILDSYYVLDIKADEVNIKYKNNIYSVGIGEVIVGNDIENRLNNILPKKYSSFEHNSLKKSKIRPR